MLGGEREEEESGRKFKSLMVLVPKEQGFGEINDAAF